MHTRPLVAFAAVAALSVSPHVEAKKFCPAPWGASWILSVVQKSKTGKVVGYNYTEMGVLFKNDGTAVLFEAGRQYVGNWFMKGCSIDVDFNFAARDLVGQDAESVAGFPVEIFTWFARFKLKDTPNGYTVAIKSKLKGLAFPPGRKPIKITTTISGASLERLSLTADALPDPTIGQAIGGLATP